MKSVTYILEQTTLVLIAGTFLVTEASIYIDKNINMLNLLSFVKNICIISHNKHSTKIILPSPERSRNWTISWVADGSTKKKYHTVIVSCYIKLILCLKWKLYVIIAAELFHFLIHKIFHSSYFLSYMCLYQLHFNNNKK